jgi:hypothetical protein
MRWLPSAAQRRVSSHVAAVESQKRVYLWDAFSATSAAFLRDLCGNLVLCSVGRGHAKSDDVAAKAGFLKTES